MQRPQFETIQTHYELREIVKTFMASDESEKEALINLFGDEFLKVAERGNYLRVVAFIDEGFPVNYQDRRYLQTALHVGAASDARDVVRTLIESEKCDYLVRDNKGRLASELAYLYGRDPALARLLGNKERKQAEAQGIKLTRRPSPGS